MADSINIIHREERIPVKPAAASVNVVNVGPQGPPGPINPSAGTPVISGLSIRSSGGQWVNSAGGDPGQNLNMDPGANGQGYLYKLGTDVESVNNDAQQWMTYLYKINAEGLYHINGHVQHYGTNAIAPAGSVIGIRVNGQAIRRQTLRGAAWETVNISCAAYLMAGNTVSMFAYNPGPAQWYTNGLAIPTANDGYSHRMDVWRFGGAL